MPPRPSREFAPAGDLLFVSTKSRQKTTPAKPPARWAGALRAIALASAMSFVRRRAVRRHCSRSCLSASKPKARAELPSLRSGQTTARSQFLKRASHAPWPSALLGGLEGESSKAHRLACGVAVVDVFVGWGERERTPTFLPLDVGVRSAHPNLPIWALRFDGPRFRNPLGHAG